MANCCNRCLLLVLAPIAFIGERSNRRVLFALALCAFTADQVSKYGMFNWLHAQGTKVGAYPGEEAFQKDVIPGWFKFHARYILNEPACDCPFVKLNGPVPPAVNHGALWSLGGEFKTDANKFFAVVSALAAIGISVWALRKKTADDRWLFVALGLILGGTVGNLFDRIVFGGVRDFLYFYWFEFPVFNVADSCLVVGASLLLLQAFFGNHKTNPPAAPTDAVPPSPTT
jgi:signal peptidase II